MPVSFLSFQRLAGGIVLASALALPGTASALWKADFTFPSFNGGDYDGRVLNTTDGGPYAASIPDGGPGMTISAQNPNGPAYAVAFDSASLNHVEDDDLEAPFSGLKLFNFDGSNFVDSNTTLAELANPGGVAIVQDLDGTGRTDGCSTTPGSICVNPDDEIVSGSGGVTLSFQFDAEVLLEWVDLVDIDDPSASQAATITLTRAQGGPITVAAPGQGNKTNGRYAFNGLSGVTRIDVFFDGSGAVGEIAGSAVAAPEPATLALLSVGLLGAWRRRAHCISASS